MDTAGHQAPVQRHFPEFSVIELAQAGQQDGIDGGLGGIGVFAPLVASGAVHQGTPVKQACAHVRQSSVRLVFLFSGALVKLVEMDAAVNAGTYASVNNGKLPVLFVVNLGAAHQNGRTHSKRFERSASLVRQTAEILLEAEELGRIGLALFRCVGVSLGKGVPFELVVPVLGAKGQGSQQTSQRKRYEPSELHRWSSAFINSSIWASDSNLMVRTPLPSRLRRREMFSPKYLPTFSSRR